MTGRRYNETEYQAALFIQTFGQSSKDANIFTSLRLENTDVRVLQSLKPEEMPAAGRETLLETTA